MSITITDPTYLNTSIRMRISSELTSNTTLDTTYNIVRCDTSGGAFTITLPTPTNIAGMVYYITKQDSSANAVTIDAGSDNTINGSQTTTITTQYNTLTICLLNSSGTWTII